MHTEIVQIKNLVKDYDPKTRALDHVNVSIYEGEWTSIMGPSGSGKTTLLNMIGGLDTPTSGTVRLNGVELTKLNQKELTKFRRENIGFIFQQFHLVPYLTALENVMLSQYFLYNTTIYEEEATEALERVGLKHRLDHIPAHMSSGEQQRVAIARALVNDPKILLADEPTGNLDQKNGEIVLDLLGTLHSDGRTIVLITHDPSIGERGERIVRIIDGKIFADTENDMQILNPQSRG